ncbi:Ubiquitin thioesterase OTUB1 [Zalerion maritima]|uniref:ubiquitinyl hydrolase 1 n=1 Tax=Zalerion maritima TaxID=339359 RepID=A0AAD5WUN5_9PEZI|nr:Ubiquitin thioesterase OTUB1 [Zalerion maritima]
MFQPQPTPYASFAYGVGPDIPSFAFQSQSGGGAPGPPTFLYSTGSQPTSSFLPVSAAVSTPGPGPAPASSAAAAPAPPPSISSSSSPSQRHPGTGPPLLPPHHLPPSSAAVSVAASAVAPGASPSPHLSRHHQLQHRPHPHNHTRAHMRQRQHPPRRHNQHQHQHPHLSHYALRSQVKMEGDLQQLSEIAAQEAAARDYKAQHQVRLTRNLAGRFVVLTNILPQFQGPPVGDKTPSEAITDEYAKADPIYVQKTIALPQTYSHYRPIRGDGNCGWRAIAFAYFEYLVNTGDGNFVDGELARLTSLNNFLVQNGYDMTLLEDMIQETLDLVRDIGENIHNREAAMLVLTARFAEESSDNAIIYHMRMLAAACMKSDPGPFADFIIDGGGVPEYIQTTIEALHHEIDQIGIGLLVKMLLEPAGLCLEIAYLDRTPGTSVNTYRIPESPESDTTAATLCLLFRPDHYDIVYRLPPPPVQVHRATGFTQQLQIAQTPGGGMSGFASVDMGPLASALMAGYGSSQGISPLAPPSQASPLSETYSPVSQQVWPIVPTYADHMAQAPLQRPLSPTSAQPPPPMEADLDRQVRFSKYNYRELVEDPGYPEPTYKTTAFKNSQYNKAHYNNPNFQPEEYNPSEDGFERGGHKKKGQW